MSCRRPARCLARPGPRFAASNCQPGLHPAKVRLREPPRDPVTDEKFAADAISFDIVGTRSGVGSPGWWRHGGRGLAHSPGLTASFEVS